MDFNEINVPEGIIQQIDHEGPFADVTVDRENVDYIYSNVLYEDTLEDVEKTIGLIYVFMKFLPREVLVHNWSSWIMVDEINMERARYLLSN